MLRSWSLQNTSTRTFRSLLHGFNNHEKYTVIPEYHGLSSPLRSTSPSSIDRLGDRNFRISVDTVKVYQQHQHHYSSRLPLFSTLESLSATSPTLVVRLMPRRHVVSRRRRRRRRNKGKRREGRKKKGGQRGGGTLLSRLTPGKFVYLAQITLPARKVSTLRMLIAMRWPTVFDEGNSS